MTEQQAQLKHEHLEMDIEWARDEAQRCRAQARMSPIPDFWTKRADRLDRLADAMRHLIEGQQLAGWAN
jgi:hypothetical protein